MKLTVEVVRIPIVDKNATTDQKGTIKITADDGTKLWVDLDTTAKKWTATHFRIVNLVIDALEQLQAEHTLSDDAEAFAVLPPEVTPDE